MMKMYIVFDKKNKNSYDLVEINYHRHTLNHTQMLITGMALRQYMVCMKLFPNVLYFTLMIDQHQPNWLNLTLYSADIRED